MKSEINSKKKKLYNINIIKIQKKSNLFNY